MRRFTAPIVMMLDVAHHGNDQCGLCLTKGVSGKVAMRTYAYKPEGWSSDRPPAFSRTSWVCSDCAIGIFLLLHDLEIESNDKGQWSYAERPDKTSRLTTSVTGDCNYCLNRIARRRIEYKGRKNTTYKADIVTRFESINTRDPRYFLSRTIEFSICINCALTIASTIRAHVSDPIVRADIERVRIYNYGNHYPRYRLDKY